MVAAGGIGWGDKVRKDVCVARALCLGSVEKLGCGRY